MSEIGSLKINTENGMETLPVFQEGDSGSSIKECIKVKTDNGTGFIAVADIEKASFPFLRIQTENGVKAIHDSASLTDILFQEGFEDNNLDNWTLYSTGSSSSSGTDASNAPDGGNYHGYVSQNSGGGNWAEIYTNNSYSWNKSYQFEFLVASLTWDYGDFNNSSIGWRGRKDTSNTIGVSYLSTDGSSNEQPFKFLGGGVSNSTEHSISWDKDVWYWIRGEVDESNGKAYAKIWKAGNAEPQNYQIECDITTGISSGEIHAHANGDSSYYHENNVAHMKFGNNIF